MRKFLELVTAAALLALVFFTWTALHGTNPLPARIPTHFGVSGQPDGWGPPASLWILPMAACGLYLLITVVSFFPGSFNFPVRAISSTRSRLEALALKMIAWIKTELICLFLILQISIVQSVRSGHAALPPLLVPACLVLIFATIAAHIVLIVRAARQS